MNLSPLANSNTSSSAAVAPRTKAEAHAQASGRGDGIDWTDPKDVFPVLGYALAGASPLVGTIGAGLEATQASSKSTRLEMLGAMACNIAGYGLIAVGTAMPPLALAGLGLVAASGGLFANAYHRDGGF
jgi:hypothetical protein